MIQFIDFVQLLFYAEVVKTAPVHRHCVSSHRCCGCRSWCWRGPPLPLVSDLPTALTSMDRGHEDILQDKHVELRRSLDANDDFLADLLSKRIIADADIDKIKHKSTGRANSSKEQATVLLQMLKTRGRTAFQSFHDALRDSTLLCNTALAELLRNAEKDAGMPATCLPISSAKPVDGELAEPSQTPDRGTESVSEPAASTAAVTTTMAESLMVETTASGSPVCSEANQTMTTATGSGHVEHQHIGQADEFSTSTVTTGAEMSPCEVQDDRDNSDYGAAGIVMGCRKTPAPSPSTDGQPVPQTTAAPSPGPAVLPVTQQPMVDRDNSSYRDFDAGRSMPASTVSEVHSAHSRSEAASAVRRRNLDVSGPTTSLGPQADGPRAHAGETPPANNSCLLLLSVLISFGFLLYFQLLMS